MWIQDSNRAYQINLTLRNFFLQTVSQAGTHRLQSHVSFSHSASFPSVPACLVMEWKKNCVSEVSDAGEICKECIHKYTQNEKMVTLFMFADKVTALIDHCYTDLSKISRCALIKYEKFKMHHSDNKQ